MRYNFYMSLINKAQTILKRFYEIVKKAAQVLFNEGISSLLKKMIGYLGEKKTIHCAPKIETEVLSVVSKTSKSTDKYVAPVFNKSVLVYQMGRVGSTSIIYSLRNLYSSLSIDSPIYHLHYLNNFEEIEQRAKKDLIDTANFMRFLELSKNYRQLIANDNGQHYFIISLVRDIIARNVSTFFYALSGFIPDWEVRLKNNALSIDDLHEIYLSKNSYTITAEKWFDEQVSPVFGIDVYETPFPTNTGYKIFSSEKVDLLVMRMENLSNCAVPAIYEFLGLNGFDLQRINTGDERPAGELYRLFKSKPLPLEYVTYMYSSKLARHFYSEAELEMFTQKWTKKEI